MKVIFLIISFYMIYVQASFSRGAQFEYTNISGQLIIQCPQSIVQTSCSDTHMEPWPYDIYTGPQLTGASQVELQAVISESSEIRRSVVSYDGQTGRSKEINLGVSALFQRPLLRVGQNKIAVSIKNRRNQILSDSNFDIFVTRGQSRSCQLRQVISNNSSDCDSPYSSCQQYFIDQKYCRSQK